ncbi:M48 family metallopeptidase [Clostridium perfringens]|nr:M48 family metallopeptidase [Clostridium perfringens]
MKLGFEFQDKYVEFELIRSKRRTMSIEVLAEGEVKVRAPISIPKESILKYVKTKGKWIVEKQENAKIISSKKIKREFVDGESFMYLGEEYLLKIRYNQFLKGVSVSLIGEKLVVDIAKYDREKIKKAIELWYREVGLKIIKERVDYYSKFYPLKPRSIRVKEQKRRWGSCTYYNDLLFNWRCIMAPIEVLDYIVVHEMTHMIHKNHSKNYWEAVAKVMPDYKEKNNWLKANGIRMDI